MQNLTRRSYTVQFIRFTKQWAVVNISSGVAQSAWFNRIDAITAMNTLNQVCS